MQNLNLSKIIKKFLDSGHHRKYATETTDTCQSINQSINQSVEIFLGWMDGWMVRV